MSETIRATAAAMLLLLAVLFVPGQTSTAIAQQKNQAGQKCDSIGTERRNGRDQDGNTVSCLFDSCTFSECSTSGGQISGCVKKTTYSNPRDCRPARAAPTGKLTPQTRPLSNKK